MLAVCSLVAVAGSWPLHVPVLLHEHDPMIVDIAAIMTTLQVLALPLHGPVCTPRWLLWNLSAACRGCQRLLHALDHLMT